MNTVTSLPTPNALKYIRVYFGSETGDPGLTLYEVDSHGWVRRHAQILIDRARFAPEHILLRCPVNADSMLTHPAAEEIGFTEFELLWNELAVDREFLARVPAPEQSGEAWMQRQDQEWRLLWAPDEQVPAGWIAVPGFTALFVQGDEAQARRAATAIFLEAPMRWSQFRAVAA